MLGADVFVGKPLGLLGRVSQHPFALVAQGQIDRRRNFFTDRRARFDLLADRFHRRVGSQEAVGKSLVLSDEPQQQVFGFNVGTAELAGFVAREENYSARLLRVAFEH